MKVVHNSQFLLIKKHKSSTKGEKMSKSKNPETIALHGGEYRSDPATTAVAVPIYRTTSYQFNNTGHAANLFALKELEISIQGS